MIGKLKGIIDSTDDDAIIIDVNGVGYHVFCAGRTISAFPPGAAAELIIDTHVREDHIHLYGFATAVERDWFRLLCSVQGVGNRIALVILSAYTPEALSKSIIAKDIAAFKAISGIGPKLAERIVTELKDKVAKMPTQALSMRHEGSGKIAAHPSLTDDVISALVNLGYSRTEAYGATLQSAETLGDKAGLDDLVRASLKALGRA